MSILTDPWVDRENDVTPERIDRHFEKLKESLPPTPRIPDTFNGPQPGDWVYHEGGDRRTWIGDPTGIWEATDLVNSVEPHEDGVKIIGKKRHNGVTKVYDLWSADVERVEGDGTQMQGRVKP